MEITLDKLRSYHSRSVADAPTTENTDTQVVIEGLNMMKHVEGGWFVETDRDDRQITLEAGRYQPEQYSQSAGEERSLSTSIFYLLTSKSSIGAFHRNASRTVHTLHHGRGIYVILRAGNNDEDPKDVQVDTFMVGHDVARGEKLQWIVEGGDYKASFLVPEEETDEGNSSESSLLISETVVPGFDFKDHDFLTLESLKCMVNAKDLQYLEWLLRGFHAPEAE